MSSAVEAPAPVVFVPVIRQQIEIRFEKDIRGENKSSYNDFEAVLACISQLDGVRQLVYSNYTYTINSEEPIEVSPGVMFQILKPPAPAASGAPQPAIKQLVYRIYTDEEVGIRLLKDFVARCRKDYEAQCSNKLGDDIFFFEHNPASPGNSKTALVFDRKPFYSSKRFSNLFFREKEDMVKRVDHFMDCPEWYEKRGIPRTLGFLFHGDPGCGKTSTVKAISNATGRHIISFKLKDLVTNTQARNLFLNPIIHVENPETNVVEKIKIPIDQRFFVCEDADCAAGLARREGVAKNSRVRVTEADGVRHASVAAAAAKSGKPLTEEEQAERDIEEWRDRALLEEQAAITAEADDSDTEEDADRITLDTFLNIFDGTLEIPGRMFAITTNLVDALDPALIRPGRVSMIIEFKPATRQVVADMFRCFYDMEFAASDFEKISDYKVTQALVNETMFRNFTNPKAAIAELVSMSTKRGPYKKRADAPAETDEEKEPPTAAPAENSQAGLRGRRAAKVAAQAAAAAQTTVAKR